MVACCILVRTMFPSTYELSLLLNTNNRIMGICMCARCARLCVWIGLTNILFIDESMAVHIVFFWINYMELLMDSI